MLTVNVYKALKQFFVDKFQGELDLYEAAAGLTAGTIRPLVWIDYIDKANMQYPYMLISERVNNLDPENLSNTQKKMQFEVIFEYEGGDKNIIVRDLLAYRDITVNLLELYPTLNNTVGQCYPTGVTPALTGTKNTTLYGGVVKVDFDVITYGKIR